MDNEELCRFLEVGERHYIHVENEDEWDDALDYVRDQTGFPIGFARDDYRKSGFNYVFLCNGEIHCRRGIPDYMLDKDDCAIVEFQDVAFRIVDPPDLSILYGPLAQSVRAVDS